MLALVYILLSSLAGLVLLHRLFPEWTPIAKLAGGYVAGVVVTAWISFLIAWGLSPLTKESIVVGVAVATVIAAGILLRYGLELVPEPFAPTLERSNRHALGVIAIGFTMLAGILLFSVTAAVAMTIVMAIVVASWFGLTTLRFTVLEAALVFLALMFSFWLMDVRISGEPLTVSLNAWGDTSFHITILRSFSWGQNYPPQFPFFGGNDMLYHFGIDYYAGSLERTGLPVEWALNMPGALGFAVMMAFVFEITRAIFRKIPMGIVAVILLITNGSLAFKDYWNLHHHSLSEAVDNLWSHNVYLDIGPYSLTGGPPSKVAIYWTLNVFMTQTQLIIGMAAVLLAAYGVIRPLARGETLWSHKALALGAVMGLMFWINGVLFVPAMVFFAAVFFVYGNWRQALRLSPLLVLGFVLLLVLGDRVSDGFYKVALFYVLGVLVAFGRLKESLPFLVPAGLLGGPQAIWLSGGLGGGELSFHTGYLVENFRFDRLSSFWDFLDYWWLNLGISLPLMAVAALWAPARERKVLIAIMAIFIFGNFVQLGRDLGGHNHKVFNLWEILMNVFVAFAFISIWCQMTSIRISGEAVGKWAMRATAGAALTVLLFFMILSGIIDFMTLKNDPRFEVFGDRAEASVGRWVPAQHGGQQAPIDWIHDHTPGDALFLTIYGEAYTIPTLAGRSVLFGGFEPWSIDKGYVVDKRRQEIEQMYNSTSKNDLCRLLNQEGVDYVQIGPPELNGGKVKIDKAFFASNFTSVYAGLLADGPINYYDVHRSCPPAP